MALIKSAMELALEKTSEIKSDKGALKAQTLREEGQKLAGKSINDPAFDAAAALAKVAAADLPAVFEGAVQVFCSNLSLPKSQEDTTRMQALFQALARMTGQDGVAQSFSAQLTELFARFLSDRARLEEALIKQAGPLLRQKEEQLARQTGKQVRIDPMRDPDFLRALSQNQAALEERYLPVIEEFRGQIRKLFAMSAAR